MGERWDHCKCRRVGWDPEPRKRIGISDEESPSIVRRLRNESLGAEVNSFVPLGWKGKRHPI